jgi:hypothetical protein
MPYLEHYLLRPETNKLYYNLSYHSTLLIHLFEPLNQSECQCESECGEKKQSACDRSGLSAEALAKVGSHSHSVFSSGDM